MAASSRIEALRSLLREQGLGRALPALEQRKHPPASSGEAELDAALGGGLPRGRISEIIGRGSAGATSLVFSVLAQATETGEVAAYIDATDCLDPRSAEEVGIVLDRLLWVRCDPRERPRYERLALREAQVDQAWQAANLVAQAGGFGVIALDLAGLGRRKLREWQRRSWVRLQRAVEHSPTALVVLAEQRVVGSAAGLRLELSRDRVRWRRSTTFLLDGLETHVRVVRRVTARGEE